MSFDLDARIADWRKSLLDTTKRNRLIKFVAGRGGGIYLIHPSASSLWTSLVHEGNTLSFPWKRELLGLPKEILDAEALATDFDPSRGTTDSESRELIHELTTLCLRSPNLRPNHVLTDFSDRQLAARLIRLSRAAKEAEVDRGVTTLFAAFGFLRWFESSDSTEENLSPLLLVPIRLHRETIESPFTLVAAEDEMLPNHSLMELMEGQFKIKLPTTTDCPLDTGNADCFGNYMHAVSERIKDAAHWNVQETAAIGVFNFQKLAMWEDLGRNADRIKAHHLCRAVAGDTTASSKALEGMPEATDLDRVVSPSEAIHILDTDSSQHEAIEAVKRGADVVLDGPPGTGKSQTIANIIAEMLAAGKTVLFVSAKIAALEVVKRRLDKCGLGDFCLEVHSQKASKKEVVAELGRCLELAAEGKPDTVLQLQELAENRGQLNQVVAELHTVRQPLGWSAFRVHGELAKIDTESDRSDGSGRSRIPISDPLSKDAEYLRGGAEILSGLSDCHSVIDEPGGHPWHGCKLTTYTHTIRDDAAFSLKQFALVVPVAQQGAEALGEAGFASIPLTVPDWCAATTNAQRVLAAPIFPAEWFRADPLKNAEAVIELDKATREARELAKHMVEFDTGSVRAVKNPDEVTFKFDRERLVSGSILSARDRLASLGRVNTALRSLNDKLSTIDALSRDIARQLRLGIALPFNELETLACLADRIVKKAAIPLTWWDEHRRAELLAVVARAAEDERSALTLRPSLAAKFAPVALAPESSPLARESSKAAQSFWHWLPWSKWGKVRKSIEPWYPTTIPAGSTIRADIAQLTNFHRHNDSAWQVATAYAAELSVESNGKADWESTTTWLKDIEQLGRWKIAVEFRTLAGTGGKLDRKQLQASSDKMAQTLLEFEEIWQVLLKELVVADANSILSKPACEVINWVEVEAAVTGVEERGLGCVVRLLKAEKDVSSDVLRERLEQLRLLVIARTRIDGAIALLQENRSAEELEAIDHASSAALAHTLVKLLADLSQPLTAGIVATLTDPAARERLSGLVRNSSAANKEFEKAWNRIVTDLFDPNRLVSTNVILNKISLGDLKKWAEDRTVDIDRLTEWTKYLQVEKDANAFGLSGILQEVKAGEFGPTDAANAFRARFYRLWLDALHEKVPIVGSFSTLSHERLISRFRELDRLAIRSTPDRIRSELLLNAERPHLLEHAPETSELGILLREVHKKQRHLPLRRLFAQTPWVLPRLKPCLMMSPLAVSTFLDNTELIFDLVIFDEASQVRPHDAICAIYRGKQLVVGGDPRQLPPTDFFNRTDDADDPATDETSMASYESLLDVCLSRGFMRKWLRWHYRSRRESLIAFSNRYFYENRLITFPSADEATGPAINFVKVTDGRFKDGINPIEAKQLANLVMEHARNTPKLSLGVIAFSQRQQERILDELEVLRRQNSAFESFFDENLEEPFFVKNLENVQGDERDVIQLSVGYGPDEAGKVAMRFGPLNQQGGERRLNVAVTRARRAMTVVSSMTAADIDLSRGRSEGAKVLRAFLDYAARGPIALNDPSDNVQRENESPFEQEVGDELIRRGLTIQRQVGCGGYRIDLAITDSQQSGKYLLGVECDGATYHSAATARDRDRLRQAVLEGLGWRLVRVWSSDWIRDREKQVKRILAALKEATNPKSTPASRELEFKKTPLEKKRTPKLTEYEEIEVVPESALSTAILQSLVAFGSMPAEDLTAAVAKQLGFKRTGPKIRDRVIAGINNLVAEGRIVLTEDNRIRLALLADSSSTPIATAEVSLPASAIKTDPGT